MFTPFYTNKHIRLSKFAAVLGLLSAILFASTTRADEEVVLFDIQSKPLSKALIEFSLASNRQVAFDSQLVEGLDSPGIRGSLAPTQALSQLLANTGLAVTTVNDNSYTLAMAQADTPNTSSASELADESIEVIVIKGENIERNLLDTNSSVNVQTNTEIMRSGDKRISDSFARAANININGSGLQAFSFSIRGIESSGVGGAGSAPVAALTVDGAAFTTQQLARGYNSLFDVDQVEVLRGPQNTAQARNSLAGAVVITTKDPEFEQDTQGIAAYGNYGTYELGIANTGAITEELAYRITLHRLNTDGFIDNPVLGRDDYNYNDTDTIRAKLLYQPESIPLELLFSYTQVRADARNDVSTWFPATQEFVNSNPFGSGGMDSEQDVTTLDITYEFSDTWSIRSQTAYNEFVSEDLNSTYSISLPDRDQAWFATADQEEWNQTLRLLYEGDKLRGAIGLFYSEDTNVVLRDGVAAQNFAGTGLDADTVIDNPNDTQTQAIFGEFDIQATDDLTVTLGGRYEQLDVDVVSSLVANLILPPPAPYTIVAPGIIEGSIDGSTDFDVFLPKAALTYALDKQQRIGFTYTEGYRQGGVTVDLITLAVGDFDPEYVKNYELSYKGAFDNGLSLNANLFYLDWTDQQISELADNGLVSVTRNAGESNVYGAELELAWRNEKWDTYASFGYNNTEFDQFISNGVDFSGNEFPEAPSVTVAVGGFYTFGSWRFGAEADYRDGYYTSSNNQFETESLTLVDLTLDYKIDQLTLRAYVKNLFDEVEQISDTFTIEGIPLANLSDPQTLGIQLMYGF